MLIALTSGLVLGLTAGVAPGPLLTLVVSQALHYGVKEGAKVALAPMITDLPIILVAIWLMAQFKAATWPVGLISIMGSCYVIYLAWGSFRSRSADDEATSLPADSLKKGTLVNLLNPHPYLFWLTVGTPLILKAWDTNPMAPILWIIGFYSMLIGSKIGLAVIVGRTRTFLKSSGYLWVNRSLGLILLFFAVILAKDGWRLLGQ